MTRHLIVCLLAACAPSAFADTLMGQVTAITGGDTLTITDARSRVQLPVRIKAIQAPDRAHGFGNRARQNLGALVSGRSVLVEGQASRIDGAFAGKVLVAVPGCEAAQCPRDIDVGLEQVKAGLAWWAPHRAGTWSMAERTAYEQAEFQAKIHRQGLWAGRDTFPPWEARTANSPRR